jgi:hypothetical protein
MATEHLPMHDPETHLEAAGRLLSDLQRYAGWLSKDHVSVAVRADVRALGEAMHTGTDTLAWLQTLDRDLERLVSGGVRKMLRRSLGEIRAVLDPHGIVTARIAAEKEERS